MLATYDLSTCQAAKEIDRGLIEPETIRDAPREVDSRKPLEQREHEVRVAKQAKGNPFTNEVFPRQRTVERVF